MFDISRGNISNQKELISDALGICFIAQNDNNNGFVDIVKPINHKQFKANSLIVGRQTGVVYFQEKDFITTDGVLVLIAKDDLIKNKNIGLVIASALTKKMFSFGYNNTVSAEKLNKIKIQLPSKNGMVDFDFMKSFIAELEAEHIAELEVYLSVSGLKDYTLTTEEQQVLEDFEKGKFEWGGFKVGELFEINSYKKRFDANKVFISKIGNPYVVRTSLNNGIRGYINEDEQFLNEGNTISFGQDTATMFYQENPYFTGDKIKIVKSKDNRLNKLNAQFFISTMTKTFSSFSWGSSSFSIKIIENQLMKLPSIKHQPDYAIMETFISAIQKLVIKDVVLYSENKIAATKSV